MTALEYEGERDQNIKGGEKEGDVRVITKEDFNGVSPSRIIGTSTLLLCHSLSSSSSSSCPPHLPFSLDLHLLLLYHPPHPTPPTALRVQPKQEKMTPQVPLKMF